MRQYGDHDQDEANALSLQSHHAAASLQQRTNRLKPKMTGLVRRQEKKTQKKHGTTNKNSERLNSCRKKPVE